MRLKNTPYHILIIFLSEFHVHKLSRREAVKFKNYLFFSVFKEGEIILIFKDSVRNGKFYELTIRSGEIRFRLNTTDIFYEMVRILQ